MEVCSSETYLANSEREKKQKTKKKRGKITNVHTKYKRHKIRNDTTTVIIRKNYQTYYQKYIEEFIQDIFNYLFLCKIQNMFYFLYLYSSAYLVIHLTC